MSPLVGRFSYMGYSKNLAISSGFRRKPVPHGTGGPAIEVKAEIDQDVYQTYNEAIARLSVEHQEVRKVLLANIRKEALEARKRITKDVKNALKDDPRRAYLAVKRMVYKRILGFNVSILAQRKAGARYKLIRPRKLDQNPDQRGGNRRPYNEDLNRLDTYYGKDRGFILRFLNSGTDYRQTRFGHRGAIPQRRIFEISAQFQMQTAEKNISEMIEEVLHEMFNDKIE